MKYLITIVIIVGGGIAAFYFTRASTGPEGPGYSVDALFTVRRDALRITVMEEGFLKAKESTKLSPKFDREGTISWIIDEGTEVKEGDKLVEFEKTEVENDIDELENRLIQYETELAAAKANLAIQERENQAAIEAAEVDLELARMRLKLYEEGDAPNEERKKQLALKKAQSECERAKERYTEVPMLVEEGFLTKIQAEEEKIRVEEAEMNLENAEKELELFKEYTFNMEMTQKRSDVKDAERKLLNAQEMASINLKEKQALVQNHDRHYKSTENNLKENREELENMTMKATQAGIVHYGDFDRDWYSDRIRVGGQVWSGMTLITLPDLSEMQAVVKVHEADIDLVKEGMDAVVTVETAKERTLKGKVTKIASVASTEWSDTSNKTFKVEITLEPTMGKLRAGVSAKVEILVEEVPDVLQVPIHAVFSEEGDHFCFVCEPDGPRRRSVKIGKNNAHFVELLEGLAVGERVLLYDPRESGVYGVEPGSEDEEPTDSLAPVAAGMEP